MRQEGERQAREELACNVDDEVESMTLEHNEVPLKEIWQTRGWAQMLKFDAKIDDLEIEGAVKEQ